MSEFELPGFRFHPTEDELLNFYLKNRIFGKKFHIDVIGFLNIYLHDPWDLPKLSKIGEREWYFFVPRDRKHGSGGRPNRTTEHGFWKATGSDRKIVGLSEPKRIIGLRKTLVFYKGRAPRGTKTDWVMNEYRLPDNLSLPRDIVLCKIYRKATSLKVLERRAAMEEEKRCNQYVSPSPSPPVSFFEEESVPQFEPAVFMKEERVEPVILENEIIVERKTCTSSLKMPQGKTNLPELQVPKAITTSSTTTTTTQDWTQDPIWSQLSPWLQNMAQNFTPTNATTGTNYANIMNF